MMMTTKQKISCVRSLSIYLDLCACVNGFHSKTSADHRAHSVQLQMSSQFIYRSPDISDSAFCFWRIEGRKKKEKLSAFLIVFQSDIDQSGTLDDLPNATYASNRTLGLMSKTRTATKKIHSQNYIISNRF